VVPNEIYEKLREEIHFEVWGRADEEHTIIRLVTSWATKTEQIEAVEKILNTLQGGN
jgi:threonine aldolase